MKRIIFFLLFPIFIAGQNQSNIDSLLSLWNDSLLDDTIRLKSIKKIAWDEYLFSNPDSAFYYAEKQYAYAESIGNKKWMANALNTMGSSFYLKTDLPKALDYFHKTLLLYENINNQKGISKTLNNIASIYRSQGNNVKAIDFYTKSLKIKEKIGNKKGIAITLANIGIINQDLLNLDLALEYFKKSLKIREELNDQRGIAQSVGNLGNIYFDKKMYGKSLNNYQRSLKISKEIGDKSGIAKSLSNIGKIYEEKNNPSKALKNYKSSLELCKEIGNKKGIATNLLSIGKIYYSKNDYKNSYKLCNESLKIAQEYGEIIQIKNAANLLWEINKKTKNFRISLQMYELYNKMKDSILSIENQREVLKQQFKHEYEKQATRDSIIANEAYKLKNALFEAEKAKHKQHQMVKYFLVFILISSILFGVFIYNKFKTTKAQNILIEQQKNQVEQKNQEITSSINYAKKIQEALMTSNKYIKKIFPESYIYFKPKDVVSGDFYWAHKNSSGYIFFTVADCTGHGVPGAFMSLIGCSLLNEMIIENKVEHTNLILDQISDKLKVSLEYQGEEGQPKDGMDMVLCRLNKQRNELMFTGAKNSLVLIRDGEVLEFKGDKRPVGYYIGKGIKFTAQKIKVQKNDMIYIFSDGFVDQFGGERNKKYMSSRFKKFLKEISDMNSDQQEYLVNIEFTNWIGENEQIDDVCVMGIRL